MTYLSTYHSKVTVWSVNIILAAGEPALEQKVKYVGHLVTYVNLINNRVAKKPGFFF